MFFCFMETGVVYMVAGMSSRFGGRVKQFAKVGPNGETLIEYSINQALEAGFDKIIFIVGDKTEDSFREMFGENYNGVKVEYAKQTYDFETRDKPWGTVDALLAAKELLTCPFVVCNGDDIYSKDAFKKLHDFLVENNNESATIGYYLGKSIPEEGTVTRGIFNVENGEVKRIDETFNVSKIHLEEMNLSENDLCSMNIFALRPNDVGLLKEVLEEFKKVHEGDRKAECILPSEISGLIQKGLMSVKIFPTKEPCIGVTNPEDEEKVRKRLLSDDTSL